MTNLSQPKKSLMPQQCTHKYHYMWVHQILREYYKSLPNSNIITVDMCRCILTEDTFYIQLSQHPRSMLTALFWLQAEEGKINNSISILRPLKPGWNLPSFPYPLWSPSPASGMHRRSRKSEEMRECLDQGLKNNWTLWTKHHPHLLALLHFCFLLYPLQEFFC